MASKKGILLDSDPSIMENNLRFVKNELEDEINSIFAPLGDEKKQMPSKVVRPLPGFCIKGYQAANGKKIFINICHTPEIPAPVDITEEALTDILTSDAPHSYKVPMSLSDPRLATDTTEKQELACDIAINSDFLSKVERGGLFQNFFITLIFEALDDKYQIEIKEDGWTVLRKRKVFGSLVAHRIQDRDVQMVRVNQANSPPASPMTETAPPLLTTTPTGRKPLIEELPDDYQTPKKATAKEGEYMADPVKLAISRANSRRPEYKLIQESRDGRTSRLIAQFQLPECQAGAEVTVDVNDDRLVVECRKRGYLFDGFMNAVVDPDKVTSQFDVETKTLTVYMPVVPKK